MHTPLALSPSKRRVGFHLRELAGARAGTEPLQRVANLQPLGLPSSGRKARCEALRRLFQHSDRRRALLSLRPRAGRDLHLDLRESMLCVSACSEAKEERGRSRPAKRRGWRASRRAQRGSTQQSSAAQISPAPGCAEAARRLARPDHHRSTARAAGTQEQVVVVRASS
eukprot:1153093-Rhodomonas_salina.1